MRILGDNRASSLKTEISKRPRPGQGFPFLLDFKELHLAAFGEAVRDRLSGRRKSIKFL